MSLLIEPAPAEQRADALRLAFRDAGRADQETRVALALEMIARGELDPAGLWIAREGDTLLGALLCQPLAGAAGLVWPPQIRDGERRILEDLLVQHACAWLRQGGARMAQALLPPEEAHLALPLERNGLDHITSLVYLRGDLEHMPREEPAGLVFQPYAADPARFEQTLLRTYEGTQDCPELTGVRTVAEIIDGHRAQGPPERWWLALENGQPVGVLFLAEVPECRSMDVAYVGLAPEARGRRLGRQLLLHALAEARRAGVEQITVSVDARNQPAQRLYQQVGLQPFDNREVFLAIWDRARSKPSLEE